jgi:hypothetical protein
MKTFQCLLASAGLLSTTAVQFTSDSVPKCSVVAGNVLVQYTDTVHTSFKCTKTTATGCKCSAAHPTHAAGGCKQFVHPGGKLLTAGGDCGSTNSAAISEREEAATKATKAPTTKAGTVAPDYSVDSKMTIAGLTVASFTASAQLGVRIAIATAAGVHRDQVRLLNVVAAAGRRLAEAKKVSASSVSFTVHIDVYSEPEAKKVEAEIKSVLDDATVAHDFAALITEKMVSSATAAGASEAITGALALAQPSVPAAAVVVTSASPIDAGASAWTIARGTATFLTEGIQDGTPLATGQSAWKIKGSVAWSSGGVTVPAGSSYVETKETFHRPLDVTVQMRQSHGSGSGECGVVSVFPNNESRHSGYNAGMGWWSNRFGAGNGNAAAHGAGVNHANNWHTVRINIAADGKTYYYLNGQLRHTVSDNSAWSAGHIRFGNNCRSFDYKDLKVTSTTNPNDKFIRVPGGSSYIQTKENFARPLDMTVDMRQTHNGVGSSPECGVVNVFPGNADRHAGYNAGLGWWGNRFGTGANSAVAAGAAMQHGTSWHKVRINLAADGKTHYFLNGKLEKTISDGSKSGSGPIRFGNNCRTFDYKNLKVTAAPAQLKYKSDSAATLLNGILTVPAGRDYVETTQRFTRPADVTVQMRQAHGSGSPECGVMAVFPGGFPRHAGYNVGLGWWSNGFGVGSEAASKAKTFMHGNEWHTVRVNVADDGKTYYYLNSQLIHTATNDQWNSGVVRFGNNCRKFDYKDLQVKTPA